MNTNFLLKVFERMYDRTIASAIAAAGAGTDGEVCERTARNWIDKRTTPDPGTVEKLLVGSRKRLLGTLDASAWPPGERDALVEVLDACPGFVSSFAVSLQNGGSKYPAFIQLARQIDLLEDALNVHRIRDDLQGWVRTFLEATWIQDDHLKNPDDDSPPETTRRQLREAKSWEDLRPPMAVFMLNVQFQLLATLDLEFCAAYLSDWEAIPIFASLLPRLHPRAVPINGTSRTTRDLFHYPTRRLLDATACLRALRRNPNRTWPSTIPTAREMATWLDLVGREKLASNLPKWRSGRTITAARFDDLWDACFSFLPEAERPAPPTPMLYAAMVFTELFVKGTREGRDLEFTVPDSAIYQRWWDMQHRELATGAQPLLFGTRKWMPDQNDIHAINTLW